MTTRRSSLRYALVALVLLSSASSALAANLTRVEVSSTTAAPGAPIQVTVHKAGSANCGFRVLPGDGARLGPFGLPGASKIIVHTFTAPGTHQVRAVGATHGSKPACGGSPAAVTVRVADPVRVIESAPGRRPRITGVTPQPALFGASVTIQGSDFGEQSDNELAFGSYGDTTRHVLRAAQIRSWSDTRIVVAPPYAVTGTHFFRLAPNAPSDAGTPGSGGGFVLEADTAAYRNFEVALPTPTISGYRPSSVCPGATLEIQGSNFTALRGAFVLLWNKLGEDRDAGITVREEAITSWSDRTIQFRVPTDLPVYISPGDRYRIDLGTRGERSLSVKARGPNARLAEDCVNARPLETPGRTPSIGTVHGLRFTLAPVNRKVAMGANVVFGGTFETQSRELQTRVRATPLHVAWRIVCDGDLVAEGRVRVRDRRTPLLVRANAERAGAYRLELEPIAKPGDVRFSADLGEAWVRVVQMLRVKPGVPLEVQKGKPLPRSLPKPQLTPRFDP